jgi:hypothetical protein
MLWERSVASARTVDASAGTGADAKSSLSPAIALSASGCHFWTHSPTVSRSSGR